MHRGRSDFSSSADGGSRRWLALVFEASGQARPTVASGASIYDAAGTFYDDPNGADPDYTVVARMAGDAVASSDARLG